MLRLLKHIVVVTLFVIFAGCSGGSCVSSCSCAGVTPLAGGFPTDKRIENSASVRITDTGLGFLTDNLGPLSAALLGEGDGGIITFDIPQGDGEIIPFLADYELCPDGADPMATPPTCVAEIDLAGSDLTLTPEGPHQLRITGPLSLRIQDLVVIVKYFGGALPDTVHISGNQTQGGGCPPADQTFGTVDIDVVIDISIDNDAQHARYGYSRISIGDIGIDEGDIEDRLKYCGGVSASIINALEGIVVGLLLDQLTGTLDDTLQEAFCQGADDTLDPPCPNGTQNVDGICRYGDTADAECASSILGLDGNIDLGGLFSSFSPGTEGAFDFIFAAGGHSQRTDATGNHWGDLNPVNGGVSLGFYGGTEPTPLSGCVPFAPIDLPTGVPVPDELYENTIAGWPSETPGPHLGLALSERFINYMLTQAYNSGALCLGIGGDFIPELNSSLLGVGLGAPSFNELGLQKKSQTVAIVIRPESPPDLQIGNGTNLTDDPLLFLSIPNFNFDFYVWSSDRYIRAMTATFDIEAPINLEVTPEGLQPVIDELGVKNGKVTNSQLIREDPATIAQGLQGLLGSMVGSLLGDALPAIDLNDQLSSLGIQLDIPPTEEGKGSPGLRKLTKDSDDYLGIFAALGVPETTMMSDTSVQVVDWEVNPEGLYLRSFDGHNGPRATLRLGSDLDNGVQRIEWQYKIDHEPWHPFRESRDLVIDDAWLRVQSKHVIQVRSRIVGKPRSLDPEPETIVLISNVEPPLVQIKKDSAGRVNLDVLDNVSDKADTRTRVRYGFHQNGELVWGAWEAWRNADMLEPELADGAEFVQVEAVDEDGNIGTVTQQLIRGRATGEGCGCSVEPTDGSSPAWWLVGLLGLSIVVRRRRRPSAADGSPPPAKRARKWATQAATAVTLMGAAGMNSGCSCGDDVVTADLGCRGRGDCEAIYPGLIGAYTSAAVSPAGELWVAGYLEANWEISSFGDLAVAKWDGEELDWVTVDGVPAEPAVDIETYDPTGFRGGQIEPGDDVGLWTSLAFDGDGNPAVAYYDASKRALRYAHLREGVWSAASVQQVQSADIGRYAKLNFVGGKPVIAYLFIEPQDAGTVTSGVRVATGSSAGSDASWSFEDVVADPATPCRDYLCAQGTKCVIADSTCHDFKKSCDPECASGQECVDMGGTAQCEDIYGSTVIDSYPDAVGLYIAAQPRKDGSLGIAYYDRAKGNLMVASKAGQAWTTTIVDGEAAGESTGDVGIGTSLFIDDQDDFHLAYVDGLAETLNYVVVTGGTTPGTPEVVDVGLTVGGNTHTDGQHIVGDDSDIRRTQSGEIHISYQDATAGTLRWASGAPNGNVHEWTLKEIPQEGFAGFFSKQVQLDGGTKVVNWWRVAAPAAEGNVAIATP